jgi:hypothetical protein
MARIKPAYYYQRQLTIAQARDQYRINNPPANISGPIADRGATTDLFYRSLTLTNGADPVIFGIKVPDATLALVSAAQLGLLTALGAGDVSLRLKGSGVKPSKVHWYAGNTAPTRVRTAWGSTWSKYYDDKSYSAPISKTTGVFSASDLRDAFEAMFRSGGSERALLGTRNGRAWLELEQANISFSS